MTIFKHHIHDLANLPMTRIDEKYVEELQFLAGHIERSTLKNRVLVNESNTFDLLAIGNLLKKPNEECIRHLYDFQQATMTVIAPWINKSAPYQLGLRNRIFTFTQSRKRHNMSVGQWLNAFHATLLLRDPYNQLDNLLSIDQDDFSITVENDEKTDFFLVLYRLYQGLFGKQEADLPKLVGDVIEFSAPEFVGEVAIQETVNFRLLPVTQMLVYAHTAERDTKYHEKLEAALVAHKQYFTDNMHSDNMEFDTNGWMALGITAIAAYAYDNFGLEPKIESEYIPEWLIKGDFLTPQSAFPDCLHDFSFAAKGFIAELSDQQQREILAAGCLWIQADEDLPPLESFFKQPVKEGVVKLIAGQVTIDIVGLDSELRLYSQEASLIPNPEEWLEKMTAKWTHFIRQYSSSAEISCEITPYCSANT